MRNAPLPRIAVVIPCYNSEAWIGRAIASVLDQSYADRLVVVVDDGSKDGSAQKVRAFGDRVILHTGPNRGACAARNTGMAIAADQGATHVIFLDADDYLEGELLAGAATVAAETKADIVLSDMHVLEADGSREERRAYSGSVAPESFFEGWLNGLYFNPSAILWRIDFVTRIGGWDESLARAQDLDITLRAMFEKPIIMKNDQGVAVYARINPTSISRSDSPTATDSRMKVNLGLLERVQGTSFAPCSTLLLHKVYAITRVAFQTGQIELGRKGVTALKSHGFHSNPGSRSHRLISNLIGLEAKVRLWGN